MRPARLAVLAALSFAPLFGQTTCIDFPSGFIPFSSISYVTSADSAGDHLVVGVPSAGALAYINANIPLPAFANQTFCDAQVQLAPGQYYPNVYVPTAAELSGNFSAFSGLLTVPGTSQPFPNGMIPGSQLGSVFAWRISAPQGGSSTQGWSRTGSMTSAREGLAHVLLPSGKVLVVGGYSTNGDVRTAEVYDPSSGSFTSLGPMAEDHGFAPTATLLSDGRVLIVGGSTSPSAAELYDPVSGQFTATGSTIQMHGSLSTATLLNDGRVLVVGGPETTGVFTESDVNAGAELFNPQTGTFTKAGAMFANRLGHTATLLQDGRVLIAGGESTTYTNFNSAEIFDPSSGTFSTTGPMQEARDQHYAVLLSNGKVLLGGGYTAEMTSAEVFDPVTETFASTGSMTSAARANSLATLLPNGQVLVAGGKDELSRATSSAELYTFATGSFAATGSMNAPRDQFAMTLLLGGQVLVSGGDTASCCQSPINTAELYTPVTQGLLTSQTGLTFRVAQGSTGLATQQVQVLSNTATIPFSVSVKTYEGGNWLVASPSSGNSVPGAAPTTLTIAANPSGLAAQDYYGSVIVTPTDDIHPPVTIAIVLHIVPAGTAAPPAVTPSGLLFLGTPGATLAAQSFTISNLTSTPITFSASGSTTPKWFSFAPASGTINAAQTASITVTPNITNLTAGVYPGTITLTFGDGSSQTVALLLVLSTTPGKSSARPGHTDATTASCTPGKLLPVFTTIGSGFNAPAAWPAPLVVDVVDDCGNAFNTGSVVVSFTDGDPPINLISTGNGLWGGTWVPQNNTAGVTVRADAQALPLTGSAQVNGAVLSNPSVPVVSAGGVVSSADFASAPAVGLLVSIFGSGLADAASSAPLPLPHVIRLDQRGAFRKLDAAAAALRGEQHY